MVYYAQLNRQFALAGSYYSDFYLYVPQLLLSMIQFPFCDDPRKEDGKKARQGEGKEKGKGRERKEKEKVCLSHKYSEWKGGVSTLGCVLYLSLQQNSHRCQLKICTSLRGAHGWTFLGA